MQLSVREVARVMRVPEKTVHQWVREGLAAQRLNDQYRFNRAELLEWATARNLPVPPELFDGDDADEAPVPSVQAALRAGGVSHGVPGTDKPSVLRAIVERMPLPPKADRALLLNVLLAREALGSTAVGDGVAIPHVRNPIVLRVPAPVITLCFLQTPVEFGALDGKPVHALFSMVSPTVRAHLHVISRLAFVLRDPGFKALLAVAPPDTERLLDEVGRIESRIVSGKGTA